MKLTYYQDISETRDFGKNIVFQSITVEVDYNKEDQSIELLGVWIYQAGCPIFEISKLLEKTKGNPLETIIEAIDWDEIYANNKHK